MTPPRLHGLGARLVALVLTVQLAVGASGAPPAAGAWCDACVRDAAGNVLCDKSSQRPAAESVVAPSGGHGCCDATDGTVPRAATRAAQGQTAQGQSPAHPDDCAAGCGQCCVPASRAPATAVVVTSLPSPAPLAPAPPESPATTTPPGPRGSIFHPPRA